MKKILFLFSLAVIIFSCNNSADKSTPDNSAANKAKVQRFYDEVINAHNTAMIDSFCTTDFVDHNPDQGHSGKGPDDLKASFSQMFAAFPDVKGSANFMIVKGDTVVVYATMSGTNTGAMGTMPATNKPFSINGIDIIVLKDGKASERWGIFDNMAMMSQLGMMASGDDSKMKGDKGKK